MIQEEQSLPKTQIRTRRQTQNIEYMTKRQVHLCSLCTDFEIDDSRTAIRNKDMSIQDKGTRIQDKGTPIRAQGTRIRDKSTSLPLFTFYDADDYDTDP